MIQPFMTETPEKIWHQLGIPSDCTEWETMREFGQLPEGTKVVKKGKPIFPRLEMEEEIANIIQDMGGTVKAEADVEQKNEEEEEKEQEISIDDFASVKLKVAEVISAEPVKKTNKLLKLQVDLGYEKRQVVSGIAEHYEPQDLEGRKVICVTNLKPVKLRGELSQGMILAASQGDELTLATIDQNLPNGAEVN